MSTPKNSENTRARNEDPNVDREKQRREAEQKFGKQDKDQEGSHTVNTNSNSREGKAEPQNKKDQKSDHNKAQRDSKQSPSLHKDKDKEQNVDANQEGGLDRDNSGERKEKPKPFTEKK